MNWWQKLFGSGHSRATFRRVDWLSVEGQLRQLQLLALRKDQASAKQLIIQADMLADSVTKNANVSGATFGERLKGIRTQMEPMAYKHLWQAHLKRNELVHESGSFVADWEKEQYWRYFQEGIGAFRRMR